METKKIKEKIKIGTIYEIYFQYEQTKQKVKTLAIPAKMLERTMWLHILVLPPNYSSNVIRYNDTAHILYSSILEINEVKKSDLPLSIGLDTTKRFELLLRKNLNPS